MNELATELVPIDSIHAYAENPRENSTAIPKVAESIRRYGWRQPIVCDKDREIVAGHTRWEAAKLLGHLEVPVHFAKDLTPALVAQYRIADNRTSAESVFDQSMLAAELKRQQLSDEDLEGLGFDQQELHKLLRDKLSDTYGDWHAGALAEDYGAPPLSVLDARQGYWRTRKEWWREQMDGFESKSRANAMDSSSPTKTGSVYADINTVSALDPFLCELMCLWFAQPGYKAYNPFAGGVQFGFVAATMGLQYTGIELRQEQVDANVMLIKKTGLEATYICDDVLNVAKHIKPRSQDFIFSCPPYSDLEVYGDDPLDFANFTNDEFLIQFAKALRMSCIRLKPDRFAVLVLGETRGKDGGLIGIVPAAIQAMQAEGMMLWNDLVLLTMTGTTALRARGSFDATRKLQRTHQYVLVFYKGDPKAIRPNFGGKHKPADAK